MAYKKTNLIHLFYLYAINIKIKYPSSVLNISQKVPIMFYYQLDFVFVTG